MAASHLSPKSLDCGVDPGEATLMTELAYFGFPTHVATSHLVPMAEAGDGRLDGGWLQQRLPPPTRSGGVGGETRYESRHGRGGALPREWGKI